MPADGFPRGSWSFGRQTCSDEILIAQEEPRSGRDASARREHLDDYKVSSEPDIHASDRY